MSESTAPSTNQQKVFAICDKLSQQGEPLSVRIIGSYLPELTSTSTLHKYFKLWKTEQAKANEKMLSESGFSPALKQALLDEIQTQTLKVETHFKTLAIESAAQTEAAIAELTEAQSVNGKLSEELAAQKDQQTKQAHEYALKEKRAEAIETERHAQNEQLTDALQTLRDETQKLREKLVKAELNGSHLTEQLKATETLKSEHQQLTATLNAAEKQIATLTAQSDAQQQAFERLEHDREADRRDHQTLQTSRDTLAAKYEQANRAEIMLTERNKTIERLEHTLAEAQTENQTIAQRLKAVSLSEAALKASFEQLEKTHQMKDR